jgi:pimeloyl-ACP methyl ester carboxylesterase
VLRIYDRTANKFVRRHQYRTLDRIGSDCTASGDDAIRPERERAYLILNELMPISRRSQGIANDGRTSGSPNGIDFAVIETPTLIVSAEDDRLGTAQPSRIIFDRCPSAKLVIFPTGGHIWLGRKGELVEQILGFFGSPES